MFEAITIEVWATLIIIGIIGVASFCTALYKCVHKQANRIYRQSQALLILTESIEEQTKQSHPEYEGNLYSKVETILKNEKGEF